MRMTPPTSSVQPKNTAQADTGSPRTFMFAARTSATRSTPPITHSTAIAYVMTSQRDWRRAAACRAKKSTSAEADLGRLAHFRFRQIQQLCGSEAASDEVVREHLAQVVVREHGVVEGLAREG